MDTVKLYIFYFFFYSAAGWLVESIYCSVPARKWINRGFLTGPLCPIYGTGAVVLSLFLGPLMKYDINIPGIDYKISITPLVVFLCGIVLSDIVEFITSVLLEKLFHARWWDYSEEPLNLQGRICVKHSVYWGIVSVVFLYVVHPFFTRIFDKIPRDNIHLLLGAALGIFLVDLLNAIKNASDIKKFMDKMQSVTETVLQFGEAFKHGFDGAQTKYNALVEKFSQVMNDSSLTIRAMLFTEDEQVLAQQKKDKKKKVKTNRILRSNPITARAVRGKYDSVSKMFKEIREYMFKDM